MGDMDGKIHGMELGADDYVTKPFKLVELQTRINSALMVREYRKRLMAAEEELAQLRALDPVTGAGTYSQLKASLDSELARSPPLRPARCGAAVRASRTTRRLRYDAGARQVRRIHRRGWRRTIRSHAARGGPALPRSTAEEFVVLLPETDIRGAKLAAERLMKLVVAVQPSVKGSKAEADIGESKVEPKLRFGGAAFPSPDITAAGMTWCRPRPRATSRRSWRPGARSASSSRRRCSEDALKTL